MAEPAKTGSWWQTLPGALTALAGVITAVSGPIALLYQNGVLGHRGEATAATQPSAGASVSTPPLAPSHTPPLAPSHTPPQALPEATPQAAPPAQKPWSEATAVVVGRDGRETRLRAESFSNCISVGHDLTLTSGQTVLFERMASFEVQRADDHTNPKPKAHLRITLLNGTAVPGVVEANCDLFGYNDLGRFTAYFDQIRMVRFER
jgi:hypothetical protein